MLGYPKAENAAGGPVYEDDDADFVFLRAMKVRYSSSYLLNPTP